MKIKFLFDLGGVFFDWDPEYFYKKIINDKNKRYFFLNTICNNDWNLKQDAGRKIHDAETDLISTYPEYEKEIKMFYKNHRNMIQKVYLKSVEILKYLKDNKHECYVLSNWSSETFVGMKKDYPFLNLFDDLIISGKEKLVKPNPNIYQLAINRFNLKPKETIFIDDKIENILAAKNFGFRTIHLTDPELIDLEIKKFL